MGDFVNEGSVNNVERGLFAMPNLKKLRFNAFDIKYIKENAGLTEREETLLDLKNRKVVPSVEEIAEIMDMSVSTVTRTTKQLKEKIKEIL